MLATRMRMAPVLGPVELTDDGDNAIQDTGFGTDTHTHDDQSSTGPVSVLAIFWRDADDIALSGVTWGGATVAILVQAHRANAGAAIAIIKGAQTGDVVLTFADIVNDTSLTVMSLKNLRSRSAIDTDTSTHASGGASLTSLASPGVGGIRIAAWTNDDDTNTVTWTGATEISDVDGSSHRFSAAYDLGDDNGTITANGGSDEEAICGVSLR